MSSNPVPRLVVTLPARHLAEVRGELEDAARAGGELAEVRLDRWPGPELARAGELFPSALPLLATYRSHAEGGSGSDDPARRAEVLGALAELPFALLDLEVDRDLPIAEPLARGLHRAGAPGRVFSSHLPLGTASERVRRTLLEHAQADGVVKVVLPASVAVASAEIAPALPAGEPEAYVVHTTGASGGLLRAWSRRLGMKLVFCAPSETSGASPVVPDQIPVDRLAPFLRADPPAPWFALVGRGVGGSRSPALHHRWMRALQLAGLYLPLEVGDTGELARALPGLVRFGLRGLNLTHPLKVDALEFATSVSPGAERAGCANTLTWRGEEVEAENTDVPAVLHRLRELVAGRSGPFSSATVLGAGGAARAALLALATLRVPTELVARDPVGGAAVADRFGATLRDPERGAPPELLVHATPAGGATHERLAIPLDRLVGPGTMVLDFVYLPSDPYLADYARRHEANYEDGRQLLAFQAAESFDLWWGRPVPTELVRAAVAEFR